MTQGNDNNLLASLMQMVNENGLEAVTETFRILLNEAMKIERDQSLGAGLYERTEDRRGYANGYKPRTLKTRLGKLDLEVPQVRGDVEFYPTALERGQRSERALKLALAEVYVQGVSTRNVTGFSAFSLPMKLRRRLRSTNMLEWVNKEIRRRTRVAGLFPNEASLLRLVSAILAEVSEDWETGKKYISLDQE